MDEKDALERQLSGVVREAMRPPRPVDAAAIVRAAATASPPSHWYDITTRLRRSVTTASSRGGFSMFSAFKFVAAAAIVALFGGFLMMGLLAAPPADDMAGAAATGSPSPVTSEALLADMAAEEVEPGMFRLTNDGVRDLASIEASGIVAGYDGGIWLLLEDGFFRLGGEDSHAWPRGVGPEGHFLEVAPDGTLRVIPGESTGRADMYLDVRGGAGLRSDDGEVWKGQPCPGVGGCLGLTVAPDGTVWASWEKANGWRVGYLGPAGWQRLDGEPKGVFGFHGYDRLFPTASGDLYGADCGSGCALYHRGNGEWEEVRAYPSMLDVGWDGTVWYEGTGTTGDGGLLVWGNGLTRFAEDEWSEWTLEDLPDIRFGLGLDYQFAVAPDGSVWFSLWQNADGSDPGVDQERWNWPERRAAVDDGRLRCDGLAHFDGETLERFLPDRCVSMDIAADGSAWVLAGEEAGKDLYVITPEAVAASLTGSGEQEEG